MVLSHVLVACDGVKSPVRQQKLQDDLRHLGDQLRGIAVINQLILKLQAAVAIPVITALMVVL